MTKTERDVIQELLEQVHLVSAWLQDTGYPRRSAVALNEAVLNMEKLVKPTRSSDALSATEKK